ncbi:MAG: ATP synthase F1 subunit delta [Bdellovibrionales bacterium]|nr:ATP synthase F1 subunit delta [Bdellovibrionales bacterium]NQZ17798.1 ATP synthase F1 subunit delta [Bdellovibrionales bacterium]
MSQVGERYAQALYDVASKSNQVEAVAETLTALGEAICSNDDIKKVLLSPLVSETDKVAMLKSAVGSDISKEMATFFDLLAKNNRLASIPEVVTAFENVIARTSGVMTGEVTSATELTNQEKTEVQGIIEKKLSQKVKLHFKVNSNMIGGIEAKVGSYIFEDSIKSHMQKLNDYITRRVQ